MIALLTHGADCNAAGIDGVTPFYNMANFLLTSNDITENFKEKVESTTMWTPAMVRWANRIPTRDHDGDRQSDFIAYMACRRCTRSQKRSLASRQRVSLHDGIEVVEIMPKKNLIDSHTFAKNE
jgi:hypothetical protein